LAESGREHAAHDHFIDIRDRQSGIREGGLDRNRTQLRCGYGGKDTLESSNGCATRRQNDDGIWAHGKYPQPVIKKL
jgi:hypothetical protein